MRSLRSQSAAVSFSFFYIILLCSIAMAAEDPQKLVKAAVANEVKSTEQQTDFWMYRLDKENKSGTKVQDMVETKDGIVARLITVNGRPLTAEERAVDDQRLATFATNPDDQKRKREDQKKDQDKSMALVRALPDALLYEYAGIDVIDGRQTVRLNFKPNPSFKTTTRETIAFRATEGTMWIDQQEQRILRLDATLTHDIKIGWGILGHIDKGGKLFLQQQYLAPGKWRINKLITKATGQAFIFKSITLKQRQSATNFRPVPATLSIGDAVNLLKKQETTVALRKP
ncbi:MAG: hypothetical protein JWO13_859 [Acidobacteriales bacterium]|nr:hypothetical protein [Terriglobales bacterium]